MARSQSELDAILSGLAGVQETYFQPGQNITLEYPCIVYERDSSWVKFADNIKYLFQKRYSVLVIDRDPLSIIPDQVEKLPYSFFDRFYKVDGLNHFAFKLYF